MPVPLVIEEDGFVKLTIGGQTQEVDLYRLYNSLAEADAKVREELPDDKDAAAQQMAYSDRVRELLVGAGFTGAVSDRAIDTFDAAVHAAVADLKKTDAGAPTPG